VHYAQRAADAFANLERGTDDELIVADNTDDGIAGPILGEIATVVHCPERHSSYHARNAGAAVAAGEWLLFVDADCVPAADLINRFFEVRIDDRVGVVAGGIVGLADQDSLLARYARDRNFLDQVDGMHSQAGAGAATGNLLVRREAFEQVEGFADGIRSGGDVDLCWRLQDAGWGLDRRPAATVEHHHRDDFASFLAMVARYGAGSAWLNERRPGAAPRWPLIGGLIGAGVDIAGNVVRGRFEPAAFRAIDGLGLIAHNVGYRASNEVGDG
jgi:glycosyltransferase involved in cell wall biosynthesis